MELNCKSLQTKRTYTFEYDGLSRLVAARHSDSDRHSGLFDTSYSYDLNGNITTLTRSGLYDYSPPYVKRYGSIDDLTYEYSGNQVTRISDVCSGPFYQGAYHFRDGADEEVEYAYDANGNMTMDLNRGITSITYDVNQRPRSVVFDSGASTDYVYSADGVKLQTRHRTPTLSPAAGMGVADESTGESVTDYCGPFIYEDGELTRINLENGYLSYRSYAGQKLEVPEYVFYLRDHLGNNRVTMSADGGICQIDHFYPFGLPMGCSYNSAFQQWRFGGKEFDRTAGLDLYDFEARAYDPSTARFTRPDPLAEKFNPLSPFSYCANNPLINIDPTGEEYNDIIGDEKIVLAAAFMTYKEYAESADHSAEIINANSEIWGLQLEYEIDGQKEQVVLPIVFDVTVEVVEPLFDATGVPGISCHVYKDGRTDTNAYLIASEAAMDAIPANGSYGGRLAFVRESRAMTTTGAHEMLHGLGAVHSSSGLMTENDNEYRTGYVDKKNIEYMVKNPLKSNPGKKFENTGRGTWINNSRFSNEAILKGKIVRLKKD